MIAHAKAHANIALAKYWGKVAAERNLPAVPSLSMTLDGLATYTRVEFRDAAGPDVVHINGRVASPHERVRTLGLIDRVRAEARLAAAVRVDSFNDFPTASGLASSASGFAALALAARAAVGATTDPAQVSELACSSSVSASRSLFGGYVALEANQARSTPLLEGSGWPLRLLVALTSTQPKAIGSTEAMRRTAATSPYYPAWVAAAPRLFDAARDAVVQRDLAALGRAMEQSTLLMHASMMAASPSVLYFNEGTLSVLGRLRQLQADGLAAYFTMDAGPHVKLLTKAEDAALLRAELARLAHVVSVIECGPGPGARLSNPMEFQAAAELVLGR